MAYYMLLWAFGFVAQSGPAGLFQWNGIVVFYKQHCGRGGPPGAA